MDFIDFAAAQDIDAVEFTAYYFPETTPAFLAGLKSRCTRLGLDVSGTAVGNDFSFLIAADPVTVGAGPALPGCAADFNGDGGVNVQDIFDYLHAWFTGCP